MFSPGPIMSSAADLTSPHPAPAPGRWRQRPVGSNWGDFGDDDELGRLNYLTPDVRKRAVEFGRNAEDILFFAGFTVISGETEAAAKEKYEDYRRHTNVDAALAFASGSIGLDLSK